MSALYVHSVPPTARVYSFDFAYVPEEQRRELVTFVNKILSEHAQALRFQQDLERYHCALITKMKSDDS